MRPIVLPHVNDEHKRGASRSHAGWHLVALGHLIARLSARESRHGRKTRKILHMSAAVNADSGFVVRLQDSAVLDVQQEHTIPMPDRIGTGG